VDQFTFGALTQNQRFVEKAYQDLLNRQADPPGLDAWNAYLTQGGTRVALVRAIQSSAEYRADVVQALYVRYLHRSADTAGLNGLVGFLGAGGTVEYAAAALVSSPEYFQ